MSKTPTASRTPWIARWWWMMMAPIAASAWARELWAPDEPRYAEVAREVYEGSSFLVMHLCGQLYPDKPPLLFWLAGLFGRLSGWSELWMRVPSLAATFGAACLVGRIARRWWGPAVAPWASALFLSTVMVTEIGGRLQIDPLLTFFCLLALELIDRPAADRRQRVLFLLAAGLSVGVGGLAKGPVALVNVVPVVLAWRWLGPREVQPRAGWPVWAGAAVLAAAPMITWALLAAAAEPALYDELFFGQHAGRITRADRHPGPPWKHLVRMPMLLLPWTGAVAGGLIAGLGSIKRRADDGADRGLIRAALWLTVLVLFYSLIPPKRDLYLLSAYPAAALLGAAHLEHRLRLGNASRWVTLPGPVLLLAVGVAVVASPAFVSVLPDLTWQGPAVGLAVATAATWTLVALRRRGLEAWAVSLLATWLVFAVLVATLLFPLANPVKSTRRVAREIAARPERPSEIPCIGIRPEGFRFYGDGAVPAVYGDDLAAVLAGEGGDFLALVEIEAWQQIAAELGPMVRVVAKHRVGGSQFVLLGAVPGSENH